MFLFLNFVLLYLTNIFDFLSFREKQNLERAAASVFVSLVTRGNYNILISYKATLKNFLYKVAAIFESNGLLHLQTEELRRAISMVLCEIQDQLTAKYLLSLVCKSQRNQLIAALVSEIGFLNDLQVCIITTNKCIFPKVYYIDSCWGITFCLEMFTMTYSCILFFSK